MSDLALHFKIFPVTSSRKWRKYDSSSSKGFNNQRDG